MKKPFIYLFLIFSFVQTKQFARENKNPFFRLCAAVNQPVPDRIVVRFFKGIVSGELKNSVVVRPVIGTDQSYSFSFSGEQPISPFYIQIWYGSQFQNTDVYYAEPTDSINILVTKGTDTLLHKKDIGNLSFSGKGAEKYKVCALLNKINMEVWDKQVDIYSKEIWGGLSQQNKMKSSEFCNSSEFNKYVKDLFLNVKFATQRVQDSLLKYQASIGKDVSAYYAYELSPYPKFNYFIRQLFRDAITEPCKIAVSDFYFSMIKLIKPDDPTHQWLQYSFKYRDARSFDLSYESLFKHLDKQVTFETQYDVVKSVKNTILRDILITKFFEEGRWSAISINDFRNRDSTLQDALKYIKIPELRGKLNNQLLFSKGSKIYDFTFFDKEGKKKNLADMKGKVFLLDFYYYGCGPCSIFAKQFEREVYPEFAADTNFSILSVNTDKKRASWMSAIESRLYTQKESINLCTGLAFDHPLFKYYNIGSLPFVLLVGKDGRLIARLNGQDKVETISLIRQALNEYYTAGRNFTE